MIITTEILTELDACPEHVARFRELWPDGAEITLENARRALAAGLNVEWLVWEGADDDTLMVYRRAIRDAYAAWLEATCDARGNPIPGLMCRSDANYKEALAVALERALNAACRTPNALLGDLLMRKGMLHDDHDGNSD